jgi:hypothetical protein
MIFGTIWKICFSDGKVERFWIRAACLSCSADSRNKRRVGFQPVKECVIIGSDVGFDGVGNQRLHVVVARARS